MREKPARAAGGGVGDRAAGCLRSIVTALAQAGSGAAPPLLLICAHCCTGETPWRIGRKGCATDPAQQAAPAATSTTSKVHWCAGKCAGKCARPRSRCWALGSMAASSCPGCGSLPVHVEIQHNTPTSPPQAQSGFCSCTCCSLAVAVFLQGKHPPPQPCIGMSFFEDVVQDFATVPMSADGIETAAFLNACAEIVPIFGER